MFISYMALVDMKKMLHEAVCNGYTIPAFNVFSLETLLAVSEAAELASYPVIIQMSRGARKYVWKVP